MEKTLLIGNGLNRTLQFSISWSELLCDIAKEHNVEYIPDLPMPLEFERIINTILKKSDVPNSQKTKLLTMMSLMIWKETSRKMSGLDSRKWQRNEKYINYLKVRMFGL